MALAAVALLAAAAAQAAQPAGEEEINPFPRQVCGAETVREWTFEKVPPGWKAMHDCALSAKAGRLVIACSGTDPYVHVPVRAAGGELLLQLRARSRAAGGGQVFWTTAASPRWQEGRSARFALAHDGAWHDYEVAFRASGELTGLRLDPGSAAGEVAIERMTLLRQDLHPLEIVGLAAGAGSVSVRVRNHADRAVAIRFRGRGLDVPAGRVVEAKAAHKPAAAFEAVELVVTSAGLPDLRRRAVVCSPGVKGDWVTRTSGRLTLRLAPDGSGAWVDLSGRPAAAAICPLVGRDKPLAAKLTPTPGGARLTGKGFRAEIALAGEEITFALRGDEECDAPAVRAIGPLAQGLFAGLEYLGKGERSSSKLDIETAEHVRYAPEPIKVTMPLMACVTDRATVAVTWKDMALQPIFASPNFLHGGSDHLMGLRGRQIDATIRVAPPGAIEEAVLWAVGTCHLPPLPKAPRTREQQWSLCLESLSGPCRGEGGWGHCAEGKWPRHPYADIASTIWRLTGKAPELERLVGGGAHVRNEAIWFVTGRAEQWLAMQSRRVEQIVAGQKPDGSFRYSGKYARGHFEDTASGHCARPALELLQIAWRTGNREALAAGVKALEYMKRFRTPRGAQTWELSLHTPDILASGQLVGAYLRGYQLTGKAEYLALARRWALSGVPFVYLWSDRPIMAYATVPVYGATNWRAPNWIGLPVQWCGGVYAYWLTKLAPHEKSLDWRRLAEGILLAGEQMQYPSGAKVGCLPDVFGLPDQARAGPSINPCALVSLRRAVAGEVDSLAVAAAGGRRVVAPFPVSLRGGEARVRSRSGQAYQLIVDGRRVVTVQSKGTDVISLGEPVKD